MVSTLILLQIVYSGGLPFGIFIISHFLTLISPSLPPLSIALAYPLKKTTNECAFLKRRQILSVMCDEETIFMKLLRLWHIFAKILIFAKIYVDRSICARQAEKLDIFAKTYFPEMETVK